MPAPRPPTLRAIAAVAGVSAMTVSRALRRHRSIPATTARRIRGIAKKLGYRPNPLITALMAHLRRTRPLPASGAQTLAFLASSPLPRSWREFPGVRTFHAGAAERCEELGYRLDVFELAWRGPRLRGHPATILRARGIQGVIVGPFPAYHDRMAFPWRDFSAAAIGYTLAAPRLHRACNHHFATLRIAFNRALALGYRRIGLALRFESDARVGHTWLGAFASCQHFLPPASRLPPFLPKRWSEKDLGVWLRAHRPDVVLSSEADMPAILQRLGARVPRDVGFANLDLYEEGKQAGTRQNSRQIGAAAVDLVARQLLNNERGIPRHPRVLMVEGTWVAGPTLPPRTA